MCLTVADLPSYSRPNFPSPSGNTSGTGGSSLGYSRGANQKAKGAGSPHSPGQGDGLNIRTNPLAAFDTRDVCYRATALPNVSSLMYDPLIMIIGKTQYLQMVHAKGCLCNLHYIMCHMYACEDYISSTPNLTWVFYRYLIVHVTRYTLLYFNVLGPRLALVTFLTWCVIFGKASECAEKLQENTGTIEYKYLEEGWLKRPRFCLCRVRKRGLFTLAPGGESEGNAFGSVCLSVHIT